MSSLSDTHRPASPDTPSAGYFNQESSGWSQRYKTSRHFQKRLSTVLEWFTSISDGQSPLTLLDYGCGSGVLLSELLALGHHVSGVDVAAGMIEATRQGISKRFPEMPDTQYALEVLTPEIFKEGLQTATFSQQQYDVIFTMGVLEYTDQPTQILSHLANCLKPGGYLMCSVPNKHSLLRQIEDVVFRHPDLFRRFSLFKHLTGPDCYLYFQQHQFTRSALNQTLAPLGLQPAHWCYHVTPGPFQAFENNSSIGMTLIASYRK